MSGVDIAGLVERLRDWHENWSLGSKGPAILNRAADALLAQAAELAEAQKGLDLLAKHNAEIEAEHEETFDQFEAATRQRDEALAALKASEERGAGLREALEPMAAVASDIPDYWDDTHQCVTACGHFRRARSALENSKAPLADATNNPPSDPGTEQREAGV